MLLVESVENELTYLSPRNQASDRQTYRDAFNIKKRKLSKGTGKKIEKNYFLTLIEGRIKALDRIRKILKQTRLQSRI